MFNGNQLNGQRILLFGTNSLELSKLESEIIAAFPEVATYLDSTDSYEEAINIVNRTQQTAHVIILEDSSIKNIDQIYRELTKPYENSGWTAAGILLFDEMESIVGLKAQRNQAKIIRYSPRSVLADISTCKAFFHEYWDSYHELLNNSLIQEQLSQSICEATLKYQSHEDLEFYDRVSELLSTNLQINWMEKITLRWAAAIRPLSLNVETFLLPHTHVFQLANKYEKATTESLSEIFKLDSNLVSKLINSCFKLNEFRLLGTLEKELMLLSANTKLTSPALQRAIQRNVANIISIANNLSHISELRNTG